MGNPQNRVYDSTGPDGKVRGTPQQIVEKYRVLSRDAATLGDHVAAESYLQHAEHYSRMVISARKMQQQRRDEHDDRMPEGHSADDARANGAELPEEDAFGEPPRSSGNNHASPRRRRPPQDAEDGARPRPRSRRHVESQTGPSED